MLNKFILRKGHFIEQLKPKNLVTNLKHYYHAWRDYVANLDIGFQKKLLIYNLVPLIVVILILNVGFYFLTVAFLDQKASQELMYDAIRIKGEIAGKIKQGQSDLDILVQNRMINDYLDNPTQQSIEPVIQEIARFARTKKEYMTIRASSILGETLIQITDGKPKQSITNYFRAEWFQRTLSNKGDPFISDLHTDPQHRLNGIIISRLMVDRNDNPAGIISFFIDIRSYLEEIAHQRIGDRGFVYLVNTEGIVIDYPNLKLLGQKIDTYWSSIYLQKGRNGVVSERDIGGKLIMKKAYIPLSIGGLGLVVNQPMQEISAKGLQLQLYVLFFFLLIIIVVLGVSYLSASEFTKPINKLTSVTSDIINTGNLNIEMEPALVHERDELGHLANSFLMMTKSLKHTQDALILEKDNLTRAQIELQELYHSLEIKVIERTHDLALAKEQVDAYSKDLERSNKDLEQFAYVTSHDLQEPLRMISSYLQLLKRRYQSALDKDADEYIAFAIEGSERMQHLIAALLKYSRIGTTNQEFTSINTRTVVDIACSNLSLAIKEAHVQIEIKPLPILIANEVQMVQLFQNLIGNAIKYRSKTLPCIIISAETNNIEHTFVVRDNGIGINSQHFERIFQIFQKLHPRHEYEGTGIGLAVCKRIVELHGGRIWVESKEQVGSSFNFTIPVNRG